MNSPFVTCPACSRQVLEKNINSHLDRGCADDPSFTPKRTQPTLQPPISSLFTPSAKTTLRSDASFNASIPSSSLRPPQTKRRSDVDHAPDLQPGSSKRSKPTPGARLNSAAPLAERLRPQSLDQFVGQPHLTGPNSLLMSLMNKGATGSIIFWGPPGCGKTTLARLLAHRTGAIFKELSATDSGISDVRAIVEGAKGVLALTGRRTVLFLDEVHRFNKAQQDIFLPFLEQGHLQLIGATTENPSFKLTGALISRCRVFVLERLTDEDITKIVTQAVQRVSSSEPKPHPIDDIEDLTDVPSSQSEIEEDTISISHLLSSPPSSSATLAPASSPTKDTLPFPSYPQLTSTVLSSLVSLSTGDARTALSLLELVLASPPTTSPDALLESLRRSVSTSYDRTGDSHYDMISALHKSVRGSAPSAALYWLARMLMGGEDPMYIARRMVVCASEDIGLADNHALPLAMATLQACQVIGMPECRINLAHLVSYLAEAPKSTRAYTAYTCAEAAAKADPTLPVPMPMRNAPTKLMKELGYAHGYCYNPDYIHPVTNDYIPEKLKGEVFLRPPGDVTDKMWDEEALQRWEKEKNGGKPWHRRPPAKPEDVAPVEDELDLRDD